jgi:predicted house-cleaning NTP pyrophosphatase (Maf/HAM1 superfamily)
MSFGDSLRCHVEQIDNGGQEELSSIEQARSALAKLWYRDVDLRDIEQSLSWQDFQHQQDLVGHGYEMTALLHLTKERRENKRDVHNLRVASGNKMKREIIEASLTGSGIEVSKPDETCVADVEREEQRSQRLLRGLIKERRDRVHDRPIRSYVPDFYAIDIAENKANTAADRYKNDAIFASDTVVLCGDSILEKPLDEEEARATLRQLSGKEVRISSGAVLIHTMKTGETIISRDGCVVRIRLKHFSEGDISRYLKTNDGYKSVAGVIDYSGAMAQELISEQLVQIEKLEIESKDSDGRKVYVTPSLLTQMNDYCLGVPKEMILEMMRQARAIS